MDLLVLQTLPLPFSSKARDFSLPNSSWGGEMRQLYEHYNNQCEETMKGEEKQDWEWKRLPSYNRSLKYATGTNADSLCADPFCLWSRTIQTRCCLDRATMFWSVLYPPLFKFLLNRKKENLLYLMYVLFLFLSSPTHCLLVFFLVRWSVSE